MSDTIENAKSPFILALDVGTSSTRALLFAADGRAIPGMISQSSYEITTSAAGEATVDADLLATLVAQTIDDVLQKAGSQAQKIGAVAMDTFWHSLLGVDDAGKPVTPVITWSDTRSFEAVRKLRKELDERQVHDRTGVRFHASYWPAKLRYLKEEQPEVFAQARQWISFGEYFHRLVLGRSICSLSMASATGMVARRTLEWDEELMQVLGVRREQLVPIGDMQDSLQGLLEPYATRWPALSTIPWFPAIGDGASACVGSSCINRQNWSLTMGTSSAIRVVTPPDTLKEEIPLGLWQYFIDRGRAVIGGAMSEGGNLFAWMEHTLRLKSLDEMEPQLAKLPPDSHGLTILPFIAGERSLGWHAEARLTISGVSLATTPVEMLSAGMESLAYRLAAIHDELCAALHAQSADHRFMASGSALFHSQLLSHIVSDATDTAIYPSLEQEGSARGAALLALEALGVIPDLAALEPAAGEPVTPNKQRGDIYRRAALRQRDLYSRILGDY